MGLFTCAQERDFRRLVFELHRPPLLGRVLRISLVTASWVRAIVVHRSSFRRSTGFHNIDQDLNDPKRTRQVRRRVPLLDRWRMRRSPRHLARDRDHVRAVRSDLLAVREHLRVEAFRTAATAPNFEIRESSTSCPGRATARARTPDRAGTTSGTESPGHSGWPRV